MIELSSRLRAQGVTLVVLPISSRAIIQPKTLYLTDPQQAAFGPEEADKAYAAFVDTLNADVRVVDAVAAAKAFDASGGQMFFKRDLHWTTEGANALAQEVAKEVRRAVFKIASTGGSSSAAGSTRTVATSCPLNRWASTMSPGPVKGVTCSAAAHLKSCWRARALASCRSTTSF